MLIAALAVASCDRRPVTGVAPAALAVDRASSRLLAGVTIDDATKRTAELVESVGALSQRALVRVTLDVDTPPASYAGAIQELAKVADVMAEPLDSADMSKVDAGAARKRIMKFIELSGDRVFAWEVGNEINGNWVGPNPMGKVEAMFDAVQSAGRRAAVTLYYENSAPQGLDMLSWVDAHIPAGHRMRSGLSFVFVSYYEDQNGGHQLTQAELDAMFQGLARRFPNAKVGIGEFGWGTSIPKSEAKRAELIRRFYGYRVPSVPNFIGGGFYWHFRQTMSPKTKPDWKVLNDAIRAFR